jgi:ankyrin repeat protein
MCQTCVTVEKAILDEDLDTIESKMSLGSGTEWKLNLGRGDDDTFPTLLWHAIRHGKVKVVEFLVKKGANVHAKRTVNNKTETPLSYAITLNNREIFNIMNDAAAYDYTTGAAILEAVYLSGRDQYVLPLLAKHTGEAKKYKLDEWGYSGKGTALGLAVTQEYLTLIKPLIEHGSDPHFAITLGTRYQSAFYYAVNLFKAEKKEPLTEMMEVMPFDRHCTEALHQAIKDKQEALTLFLLSHCKKYEGGEALLSAYQNKWIEVISQLLDKGAAVDVATGDTECPTLMFKAVDSGNSALVTLLLKHKANLNYQRTIGKNTQTPISYAIKKGHENFVEQMMADQNYSWNKSTVFAVLESMYKKRTHVLSVLLKDHKITEAYSLEEYWYKGMGTVLKIAVDEGFVDSITLLIQHGANPHKVPDEQGLVSAFTRALMLFKQGKKEPLKAMLTAMFPAADQADDPIVTKALEDATKEKNEELTLLLLQYCKKYEGGDALVFAYQNDWIEVIKQLLEKGAAVDIKFDDGKCPTLMFKAVDTANLPLLNLLLEHGANLNYQKTIDNITYTPISYAIRKKNRTFVEKMITASNYTWNESTVLAVLEAMYTKQPDLLPMILKEHVITPQYSLDIYMYSDRDTALRMAVDEAFLESISLLIQHGANPHKVAGTLVGTPFNSALTLFKNGTKEPLKVMLTAMSATAGQADDPIIAKALTDAINDKNKELTLLILEKCKVKPDAQALVQAYELGWSEVIESLLEKGADPDAETGNRECPTLLFKAIATNDQALLTLLLKYKANLNDQKVLKSPISYAIQKGNTAFARQMMADPNFTWKKDTVLAVLECMKQGDVRLLEDLLKDHKITPDYSLDDCFWTGEGTALKMAVDKRLLNAIPLLIQHGARPHHWRVIGLTSPFDSAVAIFKAGKEGPMTWPLTYMLNAMFPTEDHPDDPILIKALEDAIKGEHKELTLCLLSKCKVYTGVTALADAYKNDWMDVVEKLLDKGANPNVDLEMNLTPTLLFGAIYTGNHKLLSLLLKHKANVHHKRDLGNRTHTPISYAILKANHPFLEEMIKDANFSWDKSMVLAVLEALEQKQPALLPLLLKDHPMTPEYSLDAYRYENGTALCMAVDGEYHEAIELLIEHGADPHDNSSGLMKTAFRRLLDKYKTEPKVWRKYLSLMMQGSLKQDASLIDALWHAVNNEDIESVKILLMLGASATGFYIGAGASVFQTAITMGNAKILETLIMLGRFDFNEGVTNLACSLMDSGMAPMAQLLLNTHGPDNNVYLYEVESVLLSAVKCGTMEIVQWILPYGPVVCRSARVLSDALKHENIFKFLVNSKDFFWHDGLINVLMDAIEQGKRELALLLLSKHPKEAKTTIDSVTRAGATAWDLARQALDKELMKALVEHGAKETASGRIVTLRYSDAYKNTLNSSYVKFNAEQMKKQDAALKGAPEVKTSATEKLSITDKKWMYNPKAENCVEFDMVTERDLSLRPGFKFDGL